MTLRLRQLRKAAGLTQEQLAARAGISRSHLAEIETGAQPANTRRLAALAKALEVQVEDLFVENDQSALISEIVRIASDLKEPQQLALLQIAQALANRE